MHSGNASVAALLDELADLLEVEGDDPFRVRAVRTAARVVAHQPVDYVDRLARGEVLPRLPGVSPEIDAQVHQLARRGDCELLQRMRQTVPHGTAALLKVPGLGPHRVRVLVQTLGISTPEDLLAAARNGQIREVIGFGPRTEQRVLEALDGGSAQPARLPLADALAQADALLAWLRDAPWVQRAELAGSARRGRNEIDALMLLTVGARGAPITERFVRSPQVSQVTARGARRAAVVLDVGLAAELRVVAPAGYGAALLHLTGSREFIAGLRRVAAARGLKFSDHGVYEGLRRVAGETEEAIFEALGLPFIPPDRRDDLAALPSIAQAMTDLPA